jgi:hypothetical protein
VGLAAADVTDAEGIPLDGNGDGVAGDNFQAAEPVPVTFAGDANLNLNVNFDDFVALADNFGQQARSTWNEGNFDGDGDVDFSDFVELANNFGRSVGFPLDRRLANAAPTDAAWAVLQDRAKHSLTTDALAVDVFWSDGFGDL